MIDAARLKDPSPWDPITEPKHLKLLGKLLEELGEAVAAASRCIIQGIDAEHPETGKANREWLEDELADVMANINLVTGEFALDEVAMERRMEAKVRHLQRWHQMQTRLPDVG